MEQKITLAVASARKSLGEYKPLIEYRQGSRILRTEVCEKSPERSAHYVRGEGMVGGNRMARGTTYKLREDAVAVAQAWIDARREEALARYQDFLNHPAERIRDVAWKVLREAQCWGHTS
jgi:hypothetical protein